MATAVDTIERPVADAKLDPLRRLLHPPKDHVIWSEEHKAWWRPNCAGYTDQLRHAGRYTEAEAKRIVHNANLDCQRFNELAFRLPDDFDDHLKHPTER